MPPTDRKVSFISTCISDIVDSKVAEDRVDADTIGLMQQLLGGTLLGHHLTLAAAHALDHGPIAICSKMVIVAASVLSIDYQKTTE